MQKDSILVEREDGLVIARLNRAEKLNALNKDILDEFESLLDLVETDRNLRAIIITGSSNKAFCVGLDLKEQLGMNDKDMLGRLSVIRDLYARLERLPVPVIAAVEGMALGAGLGLALACDFRIVSAGATLAFPEVDLGVIPACGATQRLLRLTGLGNVLELVLTAKRFSGKEAHDYGIAHQVVPAGECVSQARRWVTKIMQAGAIAIREAKQAIYSGFGRELEDGLKIELLGYKQCLKSGDRLEGIKAFLEKRKPIFYGKE